ncbi:MAG TPA: DUF4013 domain-containing protein [Methanobacterium sp.]|nr:DUF4013 domain-containing protein [Methanobacterium sp.]
MKLSSMFKDCARFVVSNWYNVLFLGFILFLTDVSIFNVQSSFKGLLEILTIIIVAVLFFVEVGYGCRIVDETVQGSSKPPSFHHPQNLLWEGMKECVVFTTYFIVPLILITLGISEIATFLEFDINSIVTKFSLLISILFFVALNIMLQGAILNMAHHGGSIISGFNIPQIFRKIRMVGLKNMIMVSLIIMLGIGVFGNAVPDTFHGFPFPFSTLSEVIITFIVLPSMIIFTARLLGLIDVEEE